MSKLIVTTIEDASGASGTVTFTGSVEAVDFNSTSDARLKTEITSIEGGLEKIAQMRGVTFKIHDKPSAGVIAQELEKVIPAAVKTGDAFTAGFLFCVKASARFVTTFSNAGLT